MRNKFFNIVCVVIGIVVHGNVFLLKADSKLAAVFAQMAQTDSLLERQRLLEPAVANYLKLNPDEEIPVLVQHFDGLDSYVAVKAGLMLIGLATFHPNCGPTIRNAIPRVDDKLESGTSEQKRIALSLIQITSIPLSLRGLAAVRDLMYDNDGSTQRMAVFTLATALPLSDATVVALLAKIDDPRSQCSKSDVIRALGLTHSTSKLVLTRLVHELVSNDMYRRRAAAQALGEIGSSARILAGPALRDLISDSSVDDFTISQAKSALLRIESRVAPNPTVK